ncbi:hypothetical protein RRF57_004427 [Xylaria bambusicola]|uniref:Uncharacterized protein n=1 Tax=Xylaria bambusicola TaxID=326684 RepID=A0AAN7Z3U8_9PEZI
MVGYTYDAVCQDEHNSLSRNSPNLLEYADGGGRGAIDCEAINVATASHTNALHVEARCGCHERPQPHKLTKEVVTWKDLPKKDQLLVITLARLSEPLTQTSLQV